MCVRVSACVGVCVCVSVYVCVYVWRGRGVGGCVCGNGFVISPSGVTNVERIILSDSSKSQVGAGSRRSRVPKTKVWDPWSNLSFTTSRASQEVTTYKLKDTFRRSISSFVLVGRGKGG